MNEILHLREAQLPQDLALKLAPIVAAYKPHSAPPTKEELGPPLCVNEESKIDELKRLQRNRTYHKQEYIKQENTKAYRILSEQYYQLVD